MGLWGGEEEWVVGRRVVRGLDRFREEDRGFGFEVSCIIYVSFAARSGRLACWV